MTNEIIYGIGSYLLLIALLLLIKYMTKGNKKIDKREKKYLLYSSIALIAFLSLAGVEVYLLPAHPYPQLVMVILILLYVFFIEKRDLKSLGISTENIRESAIIGVVVGIVIFIYPAITIIMFYCKVGLSDAFVYLVHNFNLTPRSLLHYLYIGFSEEIIFRGFLQRRFLESMKPGYAIVSVALLFTFIHLLNYSTISLGAVYDCSQKFGTALIFGYLMYRTDNILSVGIVHTFGNFVKLIGGI
ncbi:MAG: type II CAAX endopeptidase family protein [Candidatus Thermoplasmatota archaeon]|nr:type II CAAX endopeptidase family protein [Candidatus Thermoplasmatota archaeon]